MRMRGYLKLVASNRELPILYKENGFVAVGYLLIAGIISPAMFTGGIKGNCQSLLRR
jgi:hypothetical protein